MGGKPCEALHSPPGLGCLSKDLCEVVWWYEYFPADMIEKEMRKLFSIPDAKETRLWNRYMSNTFEPLNKPDSTIQDAGLYQGQVWTSSGIIWKGLNTSALLFSQSQPTLYLYYQIKSTRSHPKEVIIPLRSKICSSLSHLHQIAYLFLHSDSQPS